MNYTPTNNIPELIFGADYKPAFDSIDHTFIYVTLRRFGFKDNFLNCVRLLRFNAESCVVNNGVSSEYFNLNRGTRQGDPLVAYIFILVMQIVSSIIKHDSNIEGILVNNEQIKMVLFADDSTFFLTN